MNKEKRGKEIGWFVKEVTHQGKGVHVDWSCLLTKCIYDQSFKVNVQKLTDVHMLFGSKSVMVLASLQLELSEAKLGQLRLTKRNPQPQQSQYQ